MSHRQHSEEVQLNHLLHACDPVAGTITPSTGIETALDLIGASIVNQPRLARRKRRLLRQRGVLALAAALVAAGGIAAAAAKLFVPAHTGQYQPRWAIPGAGPGEQLNLAGTDFRHVALQIASDIPYPPGFESYRDYVMAMQVSPTDRPYPSCKPSSCRVEVSTGELHGAFATSAFIAWVVDWRREMIAGRLAAAARDARVIEGALKWRAVRAWDPHPSVSLPGDNGTTHPSQFGWMIPFIGAVRAGDLAGVNAVIADPRYSGNFFICMPGLMLHNQLGGAALVRYLDRDHPADARKTFAFYARGHW
jgi:hypothetical protein